MLLRLSLYAVFLVSCTIETAPLEPRDAGNVSIPPHTHDLPPHTHDLEAHNHDWSDLTTGPREGKVGIGTSEPTALVHATGTTTEPLTGTVSVLKGTTTVSGAGTFFTQQLRAGDAIKIGGEVIAVSKINGMESLELASAHVTGASDATAYVDPYLLSIDSGDSQSRFVIDRHGDVGVGTSEPQATLHVNGDILCTGGILGPSGAKRLDINVFAVGYGNTGVAQDHSVYVNGVQVSTASRAVHLTVLNGTNGSVVYSSTFDTHDYPTEQGSLLASRISFYNRNGNILILHTYDQPSYISPALADALNNVMKSTRIVNEGVAYRGAFAIAYQHGKGKLAEDVSNQPGGAVQYGENIRANASIQFVTYVGW